MTFPALSPRHLDWSTNPVTADSGATLIAEMVTHLTTAATTHSGISRLDSSTAGTSARVDCASVSDSVDTAMTMDTTARVFEDVTQNFVFGEKGDATMPQYLRISLSRACL